MILLAVCSTVAASSFVTQAEVIASAPDHYTLRQEAVSALNPSTLWNKLIQPADWWHPDHTYSGDANNLSLEARAGGVWHEEWDSGSVVHGIVLLVQDQKTLRLNAPFGPLQDLGVSVVWTITIEPEGDGSKVTFDEIANGTNNSNLEKLAPAVDFVKIQAIKRLVAE